MLLIINSTYHILFSQVTDYTSLTYKMQVQNDLSVDAIEKNILSWSKSTLYVENFSLHCQISENVFLHTIQQQQQR